jgi:hypothetical protein
MNNDPYRDPRFTCGWTATFHQLDSLGVAEATQDLLCPLHGLDADDDVDDKVD